MKDSIEWASWGNSEAWLIQYQRSVNDTTLLHGNMEIRFQGIPVVKGQFDHNLKTGYWEHFDPQTGSPSASGNYSNGRRKGQWNFFYPNQNLRATKTYRNGDAFETHASFYANGETRSSLTYGNDTLLRKAIQFYPTGDTAEVRTFKWMQETANVSLRSYYLQGPKLEEYDYFLNTTNEIFFPFKRKKDAAFIFTHFSTPDIEFSASQNAFQLDGQYRKFHSSGYLWEHFSFDHDTLSAVIYLGDQWGNPQAETVNLSGSGQIVRTFHSGDTAAVYTIANGLKDGKASYNFKENRQSAEGEWTYGKPMGNWVIRDREDRIIRSIAFESDLSGHYTIHQTNTTDEENGAFQNGRRTGEWVTIDRYKDTLLTRAYSQGRLDGPFERFNRGILQRTGNFASNAPIGSWKSLNARQKVTWQEDFNAFVSDRLDPLPMQLSLRFDTSPPGAFTNNMIMPTMLSGSLLTNQIVVEGEPLNMTVLIDRESPLNKGEDFSLRGAPQTGDVVFMVTVEDTGHLIEIECLSYTQKAYYVAALRTLQNIPYFKPATLNGLPFQMKQMVIFNFDTL